MLKLILDIFALASVVTFAVPVSIFIVIVMVMVIVIVMVMVVVIVIAVEEGGREGGGWLECGL